MLVDFSRIAGLEQVSAWGVQLTWGAFYDASLQLLLRNVCLTSHVGSKARFTDHE